MKRRTLLAAAPALLVSLLSACGARDSATSTAPGATAAQPTSAPQPTIAPQSTAIPQPTIAAAATGPAAPELTGGGEWINSPPLTLEGLRGQVVLVQFWTYGCYNCRNTLGHVQEWWQAYKDKGLVIVGVHTPEFSSERDLSNVQRATEDLGVSWPVILDNDKQIWRAYRNNYWPRFYLVNKQGQIVYDHIGEGAYDETARQIEAALAVE